MEKSFIVTPESEYFKDLNKHWERSEQQRVFINKFLEENGIEANEYLVGGDGLVNVPFKDRSKKDITLYIIPTEKDLVNFAKMLTKPDSRGLQSFRKNSKIGKDFAQKCIDEKVVINLHSPDIRDYFKSIGWNACSYCRFMYNGDMYIKINSDCLKDNDIPNGFVEIKLSEYYKAKENCENKENEK